MRQELILSGSVTGALLLTTSMAMGQATDPVVYDNYASGYGTALSSSQLDSLYPFDSQVADDFILGANYTITGMTWTGGFFNGSPITVPNWNLLIYNDAGGQPTGGPLDPSGTAILNSQHGVIGRVDNLDGTFTWSVDLTASIALSSATTYWAAVQGEHFFPPQFGISDSLDQVGSTALQGFPLLGTNYWDGVLAGDTAFKLHGVLTPAPGALALLGVAGLVARRRRRN